MKEEIAIVVGGAACGFEDLNSLPEEILKSAGFFAVNDVGTILNYPLRGWVSLHPEKFLATTPFWIQKRLQNNLGIHGCEIIGWGEKPGEMAGVTQWSDFLSQGSSGLFGVGAAITMGYRQIICCGIPMDLQVNRFLGRQSFPTDKAADVYRPFWEANIALLKGRVFSQSGWTKKLLGSWSEKKIDDNN